MERGKDKKEVSGKAEDIMDKIHKTRQKDREKKKAVNKELF